MSHFAVIVIGDDHEGQLAPYQENNMGDCPEEYMEFNDETEDVTNGWENDTLTRVRLEDGTLVSPSDKQFPKDQWYHKAPEDMERLEVPVQEIYGSIEEYVKDYHGFERNEEGLFGYMHNPNCTWDWYSIGGRWTGYFPLKEGAEGSLGTPGVFGTAPEARTADQIRVGDVDFERGRDEAEKFARERFVPWREAFERYGQPESWTTMMERYPDDIDKAREEYHAQGAISSTSETFGFFTDPIEDVGFNEEDYIQRMRNGSLVPYAIVKDGKWHGRGEMGWWGMSSGDMDEAEWDARFQALMTDLPPDTLLTMVDCHI